MTNENKGNATSEPTSENGTTHGGAGESKGLFGAIAKYPVVFCLAIPIVLTVITIIGFTRDDYVEDSVGEIWIPQGDQLAKNKDYLDSVGKAEFTSTSFAAMSISRDGGNLFTESRLEEIRERMDAVEHMTVRALSLLLLLVLLLFLLASAFLPGSNGFSSFFCRGRS